MARSKTSHGRIIFMLVKSASFSLIFVFLFFFLSQPIHFTRKFGIGRCCTEKMFLSQHILSAMNHIPRELDMLKRFGLSGSHVSTTPLEATNATFKRRLKYSLFRVNKLLHNLPHNFKNADYLQITSFFLSCCPSHLDSIFLYSEVSLFSTSSLLPNWRKISAVIPESCLSIWFDIFGKEWRIWKKKLYLDIVKKQLISFQQTPEAAVRDILKYQYTNSSKLLFKFDKKKEVEICASYHCLDVYIFIRKLMYSLICNQNETYFFDYCCGYWLFHVFLPSHLQHFL